MLLVFLLILLILLSLFEYKINNREIVSPPVLFLVPFVIAVFVAILYKSEWFFTLHWYTFFVIITGCISFCVGDFISKKIKINNKISIKKNYIIENWKLIFFLLLEVVSYLWKLRCIKVFGANHGYNTLPKALGYLNYIGKFTTEEYIKYPSVLTVFLDIVTVAGFVWACLLAIELANKNKNNDKKVNNRILIIINFLLCVVGSLTSGGRGGAVQLIVAFICIYLFMYTKLNFNIKKKIPIKVILKILVIIIITGCGFILTMDLLGRREIHMIGKYIANYIGAQIFNLDYYLTLNFKKSIIFGQETFQPIILFASKIFGINNWNNYRLDLPFVYIKSKSLGLIDLGNVYTTFYAYIHDFGFFGVVIMPFIIGFISRFFYNFIKRSINTNRVTLSLLIYSNITYALAFSYFSNKFFELIIVPNMVKKIVFYYIILFFLYKTKLFNNEGGVSNEI